MYLRLASGLEPVPLTHTHGPGSDHPAGHAEDQQHRPGTHGHQSLHHEARVEADLVECTNAVRRGVCEKPACAHEKPALDQRFPSLCLVPPVSCNHDAVSVLV